MPEEPDEVFYDWGKIVSEPSEPSEPRKFYDESGKLVDGVFLFCDSEKMLSESHPYGVQVSKAKYSLILKEKQIKLLFNFEVVIASLLIMLMLIWEWNQSQVDISVLTFSEVPHRFVFMLYVLSAVKVLLVTSAICFVFHIFKSVITGIASIGMVYYLSAILFCFCFPSIVEVMLNVSESHSINNYVNVASALKEYQSNPTKANFAEIESLFNNKNNKQYLDYIKSATGDSESFKNVVTALRNNTLPKMNKLGYVCFLEKVYDGETKSDLCIKHFNNRNQMVIAVILLVLMLVCLIYMTYSMRLNVLQRLNNIKDAEYAGKDLFWKV